ncbi:hypothetical protein AWE51_17565 [Aquimarina aggregata]|uniref:Inclusion body protein n=1 Tax=Aquimarina aggregata TaxID=1642818 RepID=A0A162X193_9FLAO|nr:hypothetical protein [Aquimarina aggregata]KZS38364.1 hypothetical protein AWE51_17565 [Aquimarina aggregata]
MENLMTITPDTINPTSPTDIIFALYTQSMNRALNHFNTKIGTMSSPIAIDSIVDRNITGIPQFCPGDIFNITLQLYSSNGETINLYYIKIQNGSKSSNPNIPWSSVFENTSGSQYTQAPDNSLFVTPGSSTSSSNPIVCTIPLTVNDSITEEYDLLYTILFSYTKNDKEFFFSIDPLMKISSST